MTEPPLTLTELPTQTLPPPFGSCPLPASTTHSPNTPGFTSLEEKCETWKLHAEPFQLAIAMCFHPPLTSSKVPTGIGAVVAVFRQLVT